MANTPYSVIIQGQDFSDCIGMDGYVWTVQSYSAQTETGQDTSGQFHLPILGERIQLAFQAPEVIPTTRLYELAEALSFGQLGEREAIVTFDDPCFGEITHSLYCTNLPWIKRKLPPNNHYAGEVTWQLTSKTFVNAPVASGAPNTDPTATDAEYQIYIGDDQFSDIITMESGFKLSRISQSLQSQTGLTLDGNFSLPIIGERSQIEISLIPAVPIPRFRSLCKQLGFGMTGERQHQVRFADIEGQTEQTFYCTAIKATRKALPSGDYLQDASFQMAMKNFYV